MEDSSQITQNTTCTAQYTAKTYTVTIYPNGASGSNKTYSVTHGSSFRVPSCPFSRSNYSFTGYKTSSSSGTSYSVGNSITITGNVTLYCQWKVTSYTVSIYPNGGSGRTKTYTVSAGSSWTIPSCPFTRSGYNFKNYRLNSTSGTAYSAGARLTINSNTRLYCMWTAKPKQSVTVYYKTGQGTVSDTSTVVKAGSSINIPYAYYTYSGSDSASTTNYYPRDSSGKAVETLTVKNVNGSVREYTVSYSTDYTAQAATGTVVL